MSDTYNNLQAELAEAIEAFFSQDNMVSFTATSAGFSGAIKGTAAFADNKKSFIKACKIGVSNPRTVEMLSRENMIIQQLPKGLPVPLYLGSFTHNEWLLVAFEYLEHDVCDLYWNHDKMDALLVATAKLYNELKGIKLNASSMEERSLHFTSFRQNLTENFFLPRNDEIFLWAANNMTTLRLLEDKGVNLVMGDTLIHCDLSPQNVLFTSHGVIFTDWAHARLGNPVFDIVSMLLRSPQSINKKTVNMLRHYYPCDEYSDFDIASLASLLTGMFLERAFNDVDSGADLQQMRLAFGINGLNIIREIIS